MSQTIDIIESPESIAAQKAFDTSTDVMGEILTSYAIAQFPFLGLPIIKQIFTHIVSKMMNRADKEGTLKISFHFIDKDYDGKNDALNAATEEFKKVLIEAPNDLERKRIAREEYKKTLKALARLPVKPRS